MPATGRNAADRTGCERRAGAAAWEVQLLGAGRPSLKPRTSDR